MFWKPLSPLCCFISLFVHLSVRPFVSPCMSQVMPQNLNSINEEAQSERIVARSGLLWMFWIDHWVLENFNELFVSVFDICWIEAFIRWVSRKHASLRNSHELSVSLQFTWIVGLQFTWIVGLQFTWIVGLSAIHMICWSNLHFLAFLLRRFCLVAFLFAFALLRPFANLLPTDWLTDQPTNLDDRL